MPKHTHNADPAVEPPRRWRVWAIWPIMIALFNLIPLVMASLVGSGSSPRTDFPTAVRALGEWAALFYDDALTVTSIVATVLVALAAATGFAGNWRAIPRDGRTALWAALVVSLAILAAMGAFALPVMIADVASLPRVVLVFLTGWATTLVGMTIVQVSTPEQRLVTARLDWTTRKRRARSEGITRRDRVPRARRVVAEIVVLLAPPVLWMIIGISLMLLALDGRPFAPALVGVLAAVAYAPLLVVLGWHATADRSRSDRARTTIAVVTGSFAVLVSVVFGSVFIALPAVSAVGWTLIALTVALALTLHVRPIARRLWPLRTIERGTTAAGLRRARDAYRTARRRAIAAAR